MASIPSEKVKHVIQMAMEKGEGRSNPYIAYFYKDSDELKLSHYGTIILDMDVSNGIVKNTGGAYSVSDRDAIKSALYVVGLPNANVTNSAEVARKRGLVKAHPSDQIYIDKELIAHGSNVEKTLNDMLHEAGNKHNLGMIRYQLFSEFYRRRFPHSTDPQYIDTWAQRFADGAEFMASDTQSKSILKQVYSEKGGAKKHGRGWYGNHIGHQRARLYGGKKSHNLPNKMKFTVVYSKKPNGAFRLGTVVAPTKIGAKRLFKKENPSLHFVGLKRYGYL